MKSEPDPHHRRRFPAEIISHTVWLYYTFSLSFRDIELLLAERGHYHGRLRDTLGAGQLGTNQIRWPKRTAS